MQDFQALHKFLEEMNQSFQLHDNDRSGALNSNETLAALHSAGALLLHCLCGQQTQSQFASLTRTPAVSRDGPQQGNLCTSRTNSVYMKRVDCLRTYDDFPAKTLPLTPASHCNPTPF